MDRCSVPTDTVYQQTLGHKLNHVLCDKETFNIVFICPWPQMLFSHHLLQQ